MPRRTRPKNSRYYERHKRSYFDFVDTERLNLCPHPEKHRYGTKEEAEGFINNLYSRNTRRYGSHYLPDRSYLCKCGWYHVTSHEFRPKQHRSDHDDSGESGCSTGNGTEGSGSEDDS
ncbi:hypothetical protein SEA_SIXAMA_184 [Gordonia phage Sixama]|uniref:Uncharacterized protein n=1 Tax=Gordonia phage Sixama TaxID=2653271 RepID=A0A5Q2F5G1_9CAUD|nr:hypothetical protein PP302_gp145 [Gordonia phage Sixama]QGF20334.1 hypothetical protein SEA_SIXAMA_184 [Gordonia phage Sixama]